MNNGAAFSFIDPSARADAGELFGIWKVVGTDADVAYGFGTDSALRVPCWRIDLSTDQKIAETELQRVAAGLDLREQQMGEAISRLVAFAGQQIKEVSFALDAQPERKPERQLAALLRGIGTQIDEQSFGVEQMVEDWPGVVAEFRQFMTRVVRAVTNYAWVETRSDGYLLAQTTVAWDGDVRTVCQRGIPADQVMLHNRAVKLALRSRDGLLRFFALAAYGAGILATAVSSPIGPLLAVPAAWRFIDQVLHET